MRGNNSARSHCIWYPLGRRLLLPLYLFDYLQNTWDEPMGRIAVFGNADIHRRMQGCQVDATQELWGRTWLMNGAGGTVVDFCYKECNGPCPDADEVEHGSMFYDEDLQYAVVDFPACTIPEGSKFFADQPHTTYIPTMPLAEERCDRKCCSVRASPLSYCKALSIHNKSQGMTVGPAQARHLSISLCITQL